LRARGFGQRKESVLTAFHGGQDGHDGYPLARDLHRASDQPWAAFIFTPPREADGRPSVFVPSHLAELIRAEQAALALTGQTDDRNPDAELLPKSGHCRAQND